MQLAFAFVSFVISKNIAHIEKTNMSKLGAMLKIGALAGAVAISAQASAATFEVPVNYTVELVDGQTSDFGYNRFTRTIDLSAGRHQIVFLFEGNFGDANNGRLVQSANPIVVDIFNMPENATYSFKYVLPRTLDDAQKYAREQKVTLIDANTEAPLNNEQASYYILTSDSGFSILRDYREDLASVGRLYAPAKVLEKMENENRYGTNAQGVQFVQARSSGAYGQATAAAAGVGVSSTVVAARDSNAAAQAAQAAGQPQQVQSFSSPAAAATYNQLVDMYNKADDNTKLQFVKYIMSH